MSYKICKCIIMSLADFTELVEKVTCGLKTVEYHFGAYIVDTDKADEMGEHWNEDIKCWNEDIEQTLSKYFGVTVTSWHSDTCDYPMVFICYSEDNSQGEKNDEH